VFSGAKSAESAVLRFFRAPVLRVSCFVVRPGERNKVQKVQKVQRFDDPVGRWFGDPVPPHVGCYNVVRIGRWQFFV
jgi:hypothetical protein